MSATTTTTSTEHVINSVGTEESHKVFIGNLSFASTDETLKEYFSDAGEIVETIIIKKGSRPKGYGFVAFKTLGEAEKAVQKYHKKELDGREISVQLAKHRDEPIKSSSTEKKKKRRSASKKSRKTPESSDSEESHHAEEIKPKTSIFVANLPLTVDKVQLAELFKDYQVESALVAIKRSGRSKGYGFVEFKTVDEMEKVLKEFVNVEVEGRPIHVSAATSEKNTERKIKPKKKQQHDDGNSSSGEKKKHSGKNKKSAKKISLQAKEKEGVSAAHKAQDAVLELKEEDGIKAAHKAQDAVKEVKKENGIEAAHKAQNAVKEVKKEDGVDAAHKAQGAVKEVKKEDGVDAAHKAQGAVKEVKKEDGVEAAKSANNTTKSS